MVKTMVKCEHGKTAAAWSTRGHISVHVLRSPEGGISISTYSDCVRTVHAVNVVRESFRTGLIVDGKDITISVTKNNRLCVSGL